MCEHARPSCHSSRQWQCQWFNDFASLSLKFVNNNRKLLRIYINLKKKEETEERKKTTNCTHIVHRRVLREQLEFLCPFISIPFFIHCWCDIKTQPANDRKSTFFSLVIITSRLHHSFILVHGSKYAFSFSYFFPWPVRLLVVCASAAAVAAVAERGKKASHEIERQRGYWKRINENGKFKRKCKQLLHSHFIFMDFDFRIMYVLFSL